MESKISITAMPWSIFDGVFQGSISTRFGNDWRDMIDLLLGWIQQCVRLCGYPVVMLCGHGTDGIEGPRPLPMEALVGAVVVKK